MWLLLQSALDVKSYIIDVSVTSVHGITCERVPGSVHCQSWSFTGTHAVVVVEDNILLNDNFLLSSLTGALIRISMNKILCCIWSLPSCYL